MPRMAKQKCCIRMCVCGCVRNVCVLVSDLFQRDCFESSVNLWYGKGLLNLAGAETSNNPECNGNDSSFGCSSENTFSIDSASELLWLQQLNSIHREIALVWMPEEVSAYVIGMEWQKPDIIYELIACASHTPTRSAQSFIYLLPQRIT